MNSPELYFALQPTFYKNTTPKKLLAVCPHLFKYFNSFRRICFIFHRFQNRLKNSELLSTAPYQNIICQVFNGVVSSLHLDKIPVFFDGKNCSIYLVCEVYDHIYTKNGVAKKSYHKIQKRYHLSAYIVWTNGCIY